MNGYICFYKGKRVEIEEETSYKAQQKATEKFQKMFPRNKVKSFDVNVKLAEIDGKQVTTHSESNITRMLSILEGTAKTVTIEKSSDGEYRVPAEDGYENGAYYTDDKKDATGTAKKVFGDDVVVKFRSVSEFVGGKYEKMRPKSKKLKENTEFNIRTDTMAYKLGVLAKKKGEQKESCPFKSGSIDKKDWEAGFLKENIDDPNECMKCGKKLNPNDKESGQGLCVKCNREAADAKDLE
jgi:predicted transport protein